MDLDPQTGAQIPKPPCEIRDVYAAPIASTTHVRCSCGWVHNFSDYEYTPEQVREWIARHLKTGAVPIVKTMTNDEFAQAWGWPPGDKGKPIC